MKKFLLILLVAIVVSTGVIKPKSKIWDSEKKSDFIKSLPDNLKVVARWAGRNNILDDMVELFIKYGLEEGRIKAIELCHEKFPRIARRACIAIQGEIPRWL